MSYLKTRGVIIKEVNTGDVDRIITVITAEKGKLQAVAKGARRPRSKFGTGTKLLCYSDFTLFKSKSMYIVNACETVNCFYGLREDVERLTYSAHILEIVNDVVQEDQTCTDVMRLILNTLHFLSMRDKKPGLITSIFEMRLLAITGYTPFVSGCMECGRADIDNMMFSFSMCGFLCAERKCAKNDQYAVKLLPGTIKAMFHIIHSNITDLYGFSLSEQVLSELAKVSRRYLTERLEKNYTKLDYLKKLPVKW
jgi:DNA repair protein RecO (recombination protein O)